jgi:hypothetical protein
MLNGLNSVASIYFSNGSTIGIAKILRGSSYQQMMWEAFVLEADRTSRIGVLHSSQLGSGL